ncbi:7492_t:CDS:1, partial [Acaulospora morrowiae]
VYARPKQPKNKSELIMALKEEWSLIKLETLNTLVDSMYRRILA